VEDVFPALPGAYGIGDGTAQGVGGKAWVNQVLEHNPVPTLWVTNRIEQIDPAFRRRFAYHLALHSPPPGAREQLVRTAGRVSAIGALNDINALPVIDRGRVYAVSQSGRFVAIDIRTGERVWERAVGSVQTPWVAGEFIFLVTVDAEILCLSRRDGKVKWIRQLQRYKDPTAPIRKGVINWYGPVLAGDRLIVASSDERAYAISPYTGDLVGAIKLSGPAAVSPVVAGQTVYILTENARLSAYR